MKKFKRSKSSRRDMSPKRKKIFSKQTLWALGIVVIMVLSVIGFMYVAPSETEYEYAGVDFVPIITGSGSVDHWVAIVGNAKVTFYNHPYDVEVINMTQEARDILNSSKVFYLTSDIDENYKEDIALMQFQMTEDLYPLGYMFMTGFTGENEFNKTVVTCDNATSSAPVIYFSSGENDSITSDGNCVTMTFSTQLSSRMLKDRITLGILGLDE